MSPTSRSLSGKTSGHRAKEPHTDAKERSRIAAAAAADKKGEDIVILDVGDILGIADVFVITNAPNTRQVRTIVEEIEKQLRERADVRPRSVEGLDDASWVLMDYGDIVVHVFLTETRAFYGLERLWADAVRVPLPNVAAS